MDDPPRAVVKTPAGLLRRRSVLLGLVLIATGLAFNPWALERSLASDHRIESSRALAVIVAFQACWILAGAWILVRGRAPRLGGAGLRFAVPAAVACLAVGVALDLRAWGVAREEQRGAVEWTAMIASEDAIQEIRPLTAKLGHAVMNLRFPDSRARSLFLDEVRVRDVVGPVESVSDAATAQLAVTHRRWSVETEARAVPRGELWLWSDALAEVDYFDHARFSVKAGRFLDEARELYEARMGFDGLARTTSGTFASVHAEQFVAWRRGASTTGAGANTWRIESWQQTSFEVSERDGLLFEEVLDEVLPDRDAVARARKSRVPEMWAEITALGDTVFDHPRRLFELFGGTSPGVTVVDLDRDGFDDVFIVDGLDSQFLHGRPDGSFEDITAALGLVHEGATSATFADFDNDGDADLFLGRNYERSLYFVNEGGRLVERSELIEGELPFLVSASAAADFDNDGLLDLYVSTYGFSPLGYERRFPELRSGQYLLQKYLSVEDARELDRRIHAPETNWVIHAPGPPNVLLRNVGGGRFEPVADPGVRVFSNSFHSTWADYDDDGDVDLYVANDFSPNHLLRNEGDGRFVDVAEETGTTDVGFGMGVTWGDYDGDARQDLYVSNMYSKAGKRIVGQFGRVDERLKLMHRGNSLFRGGDGVFEKVSGTKAPAMLVESAGWSWGGQFVDFDSDGWLDIYALSGMITAPKEFEIPVDI